MLDIKSAEYTDLDKSIVDFIIYNPRLGDYIPLTYIRGIDNNFLDFDEKELEEWIKNNEDKILYDEEKLLNMEFNRKKVNKSDEIEGKFISILKSGFVTSVSDKRFYANLSDINKLKNGYDLTVLSDKTKMNVKTMDGVITLAIDDVKTALKELGENYQNLLSKKWELEEKLNNATTIEEVEAIVWE